MNNLTKLAAVLVMRHVWNRVPPEIIRFPDPRLYQSCEWVGEIDDEVREIAKHLVETLKRVSYGLGVGLAAPQLGYSKRIIAFRLPRRKYVCMVNPQIISKRFKIRSLERCLSFRGLHAIKRYLWIKVKFFDLGGREHTLILKRTPAIVMQQEIDHLNGILVSDHKR